MQRRLLLALLTPLLCCARSFDVISTDTGGVEVVIVPIHHSSLLLQFKGKAIYVDPDGKGNTADLPKADFIFYTAGEKDTPANYAMLHKRETVVVTTLAEKKTYGEITAEPVSGGYVFTMAGRRFYVSGNAAPAKLEPVDAAFVCMSVKCAKDAAAVAGSVQTRVLFPYRFEGRNLQGLKSTPAKEIRRRNWY
jgi:hypothetical protein